MTRDLKLALDQLVRAIEDEGPEPSYHRLMKQRTERGWPTLMEAVRAVLSAPEAQKIRNRA